MTPTFKLDTSEFNKTLTEYLKWNRRDLADILNLKMLMILKKARALTPHASRQEILASVGAVDTFKTNRKGQSKRTGFALQKAHGSAYALTKYWAKKLGRPVPRKGEIDEAARKFVGRRLSAVNALKAGWNAAIRKYASIARAKLDSMKGGGRIHQPSKASPAQPGWNPIALAEYRLTEKKPGGEQIDPRAETALSIAFAEETTSMQFYIENKMRERVEAMQKA